jgi:hypothetical protein
MVKNLLAMKDRIWIIKNFQNQIDLETVLFCERRQMIKKFAAPELYNHTYTQSGLIPTIDLLS